MREMPAAQEAKSLLRGASRRLYTADPSAVRELSDLLDDSLPLPAGHPAYRRQRALEPRFEEEAGEHLSFLMRPGGPLASPGDRVDLSTRAMRQIVGGHFGREALRWLDGRIEPAASDRRVVSWGASLGSGLDRDGLAEATVTYEWGPELLEAFPDSLFKIARIAVDALPSLRPALCTIRCGRSSGSQQVTFAVDAALPLNSLKPLMDGLGIGHQHAGLMSACAFILGARFTLPPNSATLTLRPTRAGVELRLDVNLEAIPDLPPGLMSLLQIQLAERPKSLRALDRWLLALTPDGYDTAGSLSVLSILVRPQQPARIALYLQPAVLESASPEGAPVGNGVQHVGNGIQQPVAAGLGRAH